MTVKEISDVSGVSIRTLHYYDEIGLLRPTSKSEAGYRLYDDKALAKEGLTPGRRETLHRGLTAIVGANYLCLSID